MVIIISDKITFNVEKQKLFFTDTPSNEHLLSHILTNLLYEILINDSGVSRQKLLSVVWEKQGLVGNNSNLNSQMSTLRKILDQFCNFGDLIITIPKFGFRKNTDYSLKIVGTHCDIGFSTSLPDGGNFKPENTKKKMNTTLIAIKNWKAEHSVDAKSIFILLLALLSFSFIIYNIDDTPTSSQGELFHSIEKCDLLSFRPLTGQQKNTAKSLGIRFIKTEGMNCNKDRYDLFFHLKDDTSSRGYFIAKCSKKESGEYSRCSSFERY
jgi:cholera toxin transcriptional activator